MGVSGGADWECAITTKWIFKIIFDSLRKVQKLSLRQDL